MTSSSTTIERSVDMKEVAEVVRELRAVWKDKDYAKAKSLSRKLLEWEAENTFGLIFLARAAVRTDDWGDAARAGHALVLQSPRDAFNAARELNRAGYTAEAAGIYAKLQFSEDWFDGDSPDLAWKEGLSLLKKGDAAMAAGDTQLAKAAWVAGARLAPHSRMLSSRMRDLANAARQTARLQDRDKDMAAYIEAWREVLWFEPSNVSAATKVALAFGRGSDKAAAIDAWLKVLGVESGHEKAIERVLTLAARNDLEDRAIRGLIELGRDEASDPLVCELVANRDAKARKAHEATLRARLRESLSQARALDRETQPRRYLAAWKEVLVLDSKHLNAARNVVSVARQLGDQSELVDGLIALLEITPDDQATRERLCSAALRAHQEQRALDYLARHGHADLSEPRIESLHKRVYKACRNAMRADDCDLALSCFQTLALVDHSHPWVEALRPSLAKKAASGARSAEKEGNLATAVPLAEQVLQIVPDQPTALAVFARDMLRHRRFGDVIALCEPRIRPGDEYNSVRRLLEQATAKLAA
jgi:hypothetical protein